MHAPSPSDLTAEKRQVRTAALEALKAAPRSPADSLRLGEQLAAHLALHVAPHSAKVAPPQTWALFASLPWEIDLSPLDQLLAKHRIIRLFPAMVAGDLEFRRVDVPLHALPIGGFGIRTPPPDCEVVALASCDVVVTPGVVFGRDGTRLGYGRGFYDRAIATARSHASKIDVIGVGFADQLQATVVAGESDARLNAVCTPSEFHRNSTRPEVF